MPGWAKDPAVGAKMFNARSETVLEKPSFRKAVRARRCAVPANGYYGTSTTGSVSVIDTSDPSAPVGSIPVGLHPTAMFVQPGPPAAGKKAKKHPAGALFVAEVVLGSLAMVWGYFKSMIQRKPRYGDAAFRRFLRRYQWGCLLRGKRRACKRTVVLF